jgi:hypothetical protein
MQNVYKDREKQYRPFVMLHCWTLLEHNEKWNNRDNYFHPLKKKASKSSLEFENEGYGNEDDEEENGILSSAVTNKKRSLWTKQEKERLKKGGDGVVFQSAVQEMIVTKKEMEANRKSKKELRWIEIRAMEECKVAIEEEKLRVLGEEAPAKKMEQEYKIMFMDTTGLDETQKGVCGVNACANSIIKDGWQWEWEWKLECVMLYVLLYSYFIWTICYV